MARRFGIAQRRWSLEMVLGLKSGWIETSKSLHTTRTLLSPLLKFLTGQSSSKIYQML
uniref:Uncharacterized protein n=1 Tax=Arundo donax TaxID=35708 RepID=A0A0A8ZKS2_ARUDO